MMEINYSNYQTASAIPEASSMIETFRAIGYNIETAIADIIDNSISANAKNIWVNFEWLGSKTWLYIKDDGCGMNNEEIIQAMRPGSKNPLQERNEKDLGRFGLGLKTASFSQARKLTVISKKVNYESAYWTWDLNFVSKSGNWDLIKYLPNVNFENEILGLTSGTIVLWNDIDRVVKDFTILRYIFHAAMHPNSYSSLIFGLLISRFGSFPYSVIILSSKILFPYLALMSAIENGGLLSFGMLNQCATLAMLSVVRIKLK